MPHGRRFSALEVQVAALNRVAQVAGVGLGEVDLGMVPQRRVVEMARRGMTSNATDLRCTMPYSRVGTEYAGKGPPAGYNRWSGWVCIRDRKHG